jgi:hypothetical protein
VLPDCSGHSVDRFMSCPLGTISKRAWLKVSFEDRLQYELERILHHPSVSPAAEPVTVHMFA